MRSVGEETRDGLLALCGWLLAWGLATALLALLVPSFTLALLGLALLNLLALPFVWRCRTIPSGHDTEWADAQPPPHAPTPPRPRRQPAPLPPTRPLYPGEPPPRPGRAGGVATARQIYRYDN
jgi:hypothetical protein